MRNLVLVLIAFIAVVTFVRELGSQQTVGSQIAGPQMVGSQITAEPISVKEIGKPIN